MVIKRFQERVRPSCYNGSSSDLNGKITLVFCIRTSFCAGELNEWLLYVICALFSDSSFIIAFYLLRSLAIRIPLFTICYCLRVYSVSILISFIFSATAHWWPMYFDWMETERTETERRETEWRETERTETERTEVKENRAIIECMCKDESDGKKAKESG